METKGMESKQRILTCAGRLFIKNGYHATGLQQILKECGLPKGSFYYHFTGKEELALQVCYYYRELIMNIFYEAAKEKEYATFVERLVNLLKLQMETEVLYGCPIAVIGMETAQTESKLASVCQEILDELIQGFERVLIKYGYSQEYASVNAALLMERYEGTLVYYRISKKLEILDRMKQQLLAI